MVFKVGHPSYLTEESKLKLSISHKGKNTWMKGKKLSIETREKIRKSLLGNVRAKGKKHSPKINKRASEAYRGEKSWNWRGGNKRPLHTGYEYRIWRINVFERDNWTCQGCGIRGCYLEPHHIKSWAKYPEFRYNLDNGVTLCKDCHKLTDNYKNKQNE